MIHKLNGDEDEKKIRALLSGHYIGDWVILTGVHGNAMGFGRIEGVTDDRNNVVLSTPQRYELTGEDLVERKGFYKNVIRLDTVNNWTESTEGEAWGRVPIVPSMLYRERVVRIGGEHVGVIHQVRLEGTVLRPFIGHTYADQGRMESVVVDEPLLVRANLGDVTPLTQTLEDIVKYSNFRPRDAEKEE